MSCEPGAWLACNLTIHGVLRNALLMQHAEITDRAATARHELCTRQILLLCYNEGITRCVLMSKHTRYLSRIKELSEAYLRHEVYLKKPPLPHAELPISVIALLLLATLANVLSAMIVY
eukprot:TRINITY_DN10925_c1_g1_i1.p1 TRINITY_DN10925_c1_g1~~TRINITY_DN10925_c1_g1_i1.p1  ORF type:complete len:119 (+),score=17.83 TRINITY_DN10925_c1_g1_i1:62-418(+)